MPRATAISISQFHILFSVKYHECFPRKKLPQRVMPFLFCFPISSFSFFFEREILLSVGRHQQTFSWKNIIQSHSNYSITWLSKDYLFTANRRSFHTIISRCCWEIKENWKESQRSFFIKNPGKLSNRLCLATVSLNCRSNDFVSLSHYAPTSMAKQWSVICVTFFPFHHTYHSLLREDQ